MGGAPSRVGVSEHTSTGRAAGVPGEGLATRLPDEIPVCQQGV